MTTKSKKRKSLSFLSLIRMCADGLQLYDQGARLVAGASEVKDAGKKTVELYRSVKEAAKGDC
jgi:hypothetical protein